MKDKHIYGYGNMRSDSGNGCGMAVIIASITEQPSKVGATATCSKKSPISEAATTK